MAYKCLLCERVFDNLAGVKKHFRRTHVDPHHCPVCGKEVRSFAKHVRSMVDEKHQIAWCLYNNCKDLKDKAVKRWIMRLTKERLEVKTAVAEAVL